MNTGDRFAEAHRRMLAEIEVETRETEAWTDRARLDPKVMAAMAAVPRHAFVPRESRSSAYMNRPLGIGYDQTISQPFIVALMTDLLDLQPEDRVLEIGTGCGYQTAVLACLAARVYSMEVVANLAHDAAERLARLGYDNVELGVGDGYAGWPDAAPFDAIIVTAAPAVIPDALVAQLEVGGRLVIPVGRRNETQILYRCVRRRDGGLTRERRLPVAFVPMVQTATGRRRHRF